MAAGRADGRVTLPVQDCSRTYGGALRFLRFTTLDPLTITVEALAARLTGDLASGTHGDGLHTLARCGEVTLLDTKRLVRSWRRYGVDLNRRLKRMVS